MAWLASSNVLWIKNMLFHTCSCCLLGREKIHCWTCSKQVALLLSKTSIWHKFPWSYFDSLRSCSATTCCLWNREAPVKNEAQSVGFVLKRRFLFEFQLCIPRTSYDIVVNCCAVYHSLQRGAVDPFSHFSAVVSFLRQQVSMHSLGGRRISVWIWWLRQGSVLQGMHCALQTAANVRFRPMHSHWCTWVNQPDVSRIL